MQTKLKNGGGHVTTFCSYTQLRYYFRLFTYSSITFFCSISPIQMKVEVLSFKFVHNRLGALRLHGLSSLFTPRGDLEWYYAIGVPEAYTADGVGETI